MTNTLRTQALREKVFSKNIFCARSPPRVRSSAAGEASRKREKTALRAAGISRSLLIKREAGQPPARGKYDGRIAMRLLISAAFMLLAATLHAFAQGAVPPDVLRDLAPTGKLRAAINFGNGVLAQKGKDGGPQGVTADLSRELAKRLGVEVSFVTFEAAGKVFEAAKAGAWDVG